MQLLRNIWPAKVIIDTVLRSSRHEYAVLFWSFFVLVQKLVPNLIKGGEQFVLKSDLPPPSSSFCLKSKSVGLILYHTRSFRILKAHGMAR